MVAAMAFVAKWSQEVRAAVRRAAVDPAQPSATVIHRGLMAGSVEGISPEMVPPVATVRQWVTEARRAAREALGDSAGRDGIEVVAAILQRKLERRAREAKSPDEIAKVARAARELAGLRREAGKPGKADGAAPTRAAGGEIAPDPTDRAAFLRSLQNGSPAQ